MKREPAPMKSTAATSWDGRNGGCTAQPITRHPSVSVAPTSCSTPRTGAVAASTKASSQSSTRPAVAPAPDAFRSRGPFVELKGGRVYPAKASASKDYPLACYGSR